MQVRRLGRRGFIALLGAATVWPLAGQAQQAERVRRLGVLMPNREDEALASANMRAFTQALGRLGWIEGKNIQIDHRFAAGDPTLFKTYAAELVGLSPDAILASTTPAVGALRQQTRAVPIVFVLVNDAVGQGLVQSLARPGGNITGFNSPDAPMMGKWLQLLKEIAPRVTHVAIIFDPDTAPWAPSFNAAIEAAAATLGVTVAPAPVHDDAGIEAAIAALASEPGGGLIALPATFAISHREVIVAAAIRRRLPLLGLPPLAKAGGLISYWFDPVDVYAQAATYIDRILKGAIPADLPVQQPTKYQLIINLKTAKALGLTVPPAMLDLADEVIE